MNPQTVKTQLDIRHRGKKKKTVRFGPPKSVVPDRGLFKPLPLFRDRGIAVAEGKICNRGLATANHLFYDRGPITDYDRRPLGLKRSRSSKKTFSHVLRCLCHNFNQVIAARCNTRDRKDCADHFISFFVKTASCIFASKQNSHMAKIVRFFQNQIPAPSIFPQIPSASRHPFWTTGHRPNNPPNAPSGVNLGS